MALPEALRGHFRGCLVGSLLGDCLGAPFEGKYRTKIKRLNSYFSRLSENSRNDPLNKFTDDTAMTQGVAQSLIDKECFNAVDMAQKFVNAFYLEPYRGYGGNVVSVFSALKATNYSDVYKPATLQFDGNGSYGNGGAMRVAPVSLFCFNEVASVVVKMARDSALITHSHHYGYDGAILQALAVHKALHTDVNSICAADFIEYLKETMKGIAFCQHSKTDDEKFMYVKCLEKVQEFIERMDVSADEVEEELGMFVAAHKSVPTAIFAFLRGLSKIEDIATENAFQRSIQYAISLGGDTDTIASMTGSIAGAYYGIDGIPYTLQRRCEALNHARLQADRLFDIVSK